MASHAVSGATKEVNPIRTRSFGGCASCRRRRLKCDEARPRCFSCAASGESCTYEKSLFFGPNDHLDLGESRYRRPVLSENERQLMSEWLTASVAPSAALQRINHIEEQCEAVDVFEEVQINHGPFGAFRLASTTVQNLNDSSQSCVADTVFDECVRDSDSRQLIESFTLPSPNLQAMTNLLFGQAELGMPNFIMDPSLGFLPGGRVQQVFDDLPFPSVAPSDVFSSSHFDFELSHNLSQFLPRRSSTPLTLPLIQSTEKAVISEAVPLLRHYQSTVLPLLTPFRHSKTPWHILFVPQVKTCLAALTLGEEVDHATLCAFYGTLSISALSLSGISRSSDWMAVARAYKKRAREHSNAMSESAYDIPKKAKYKSVLIALLSMVQLSIISGTPSQTEDCLLEAERFIRLRGLPRQKSRKVRLLHHCYAFERILFESTRINGEARSHQRVERGHVEAHRAECANEYALSFRLSPWTNLEQEMLRAKTREEGENDLHLQLPGDWSATLYPEIFGVPEQWVLLVSLIIQLAKEKEDEVQQRGGAGLSVKEFMDRARAIEALIHRLQPSVEDAELSNLLEAMQNALAIYFYRRIYNIDAAVLHPKVASVKRCLLRLQSQQFATIYGAARFIWPAFIAACEAEDPENRVAFSSWFRDSAERSGLRLFSMTLSSIEALWEAKQSKTFSMPATLPFVTGMG